MSRFFHNSKKSKAAFSVAELMLAVAIMGIIVYALYSLFNQTQKALRASYNQVDVLEGGRAAMEVLTREIEQLSAFDPVNGTNFWVSLMPASVPAVVQNDYAGTPLRTNILEQVFFLSRANKHWVGSAFRVFEATNGIGLLQRYSTNIHASFFSSNTMVNHFLAATPSDPATPSAFYHRLADGVIHLRVKTYDAAGRPWDYALTNYVYPNTNVGGVRYFWVNASPTNDPPNVILRQRNTRTVENKTVYDTEALFLSNALPGYVEIELGLLEEETLKQFNAIRQGPVQVANNFLRDNAGKVHLFRKRIPIRMASQ